MDSMLLLAPGVPRKTLPRQDRAGYNAFTLVSPLPSSPMKSAVLCLGILVSLIVGSAASDSVVVFNEVSYHSATDESANEWIELHNQMSIDIDLSGWHIEDGVNFTFVEGTVIPGHGYLVVASNPSALQ